MTFVAQIGDAIQTIAESSVEWEIRDFFSLSDKADDYYDSSVFNFAESQWFFRLYPNGEADDELAECVSLYLWRKEKHPMKTVSFTFGIRCSNGTIENKAEEKEDFTAKYDGWGVEFWSRAELRTQASKFMPGNVLTITCNLKCCQPNATKVSWSNRVQKVSRNIKTILAEGKRTDFTLKLHNREWPVHKVILESRSEYFAIMFSHEWVENTVGEVKFEDMKEDVLDKVLNFIYSGDVENMTKENICEIYIAADKFLLDDLKTFCIEFMLENMCSKIVCKVLVIADTYGEEELKLSAIEYFNQKAEKVFDSEQWKELKKTHLPIVAELLEETTKRERKRRKI